MMMQEWHPQAFPNHTEDFEDDYLAAIMDQWGVDRTPEEIGVDFEGKHARLLNPREFRTIPGGHNLTQLLNEGADPPNIDEPEQVLDWNNSAKALMDWNNVAHVLETFV